MNKEESGVIFMNYAKNMEILKVIASKKIQTITYAGFSKNDFKIILSKRSFKGIDRIVPVGSGFDMGNIWDGKNFYEIFTRIIDIK